MAHHVDCPATGDVHRAGENRWDGSPEHVPGTGTTPVDSPMVPLGIALVVSRRHRLPIRPAAARAINPCLARYGFLLADEVSPACARPVTPDCRDSRDPLTVAMVVGHSHTVWPGARSTCVCDLWIRICPGLLVHRQLELLQDPRRYWRVNLGIGMLATIFSLYLTDWQNAILAFPSDVTQHLQYAATDGVSVMSL